MLIMHLIRRSDRHDDGMTITERCIDLLETLYYCEVTKKSGRSDETNRKISEYEEFLRGISESDLVLMVNRRFWSHGRDREIDILIVDTEK